jgi:hypothetical protein
MTLQLLHSEFPYMRGNLLFFFISVVHKNKVLFSFLVCNGYNSNQAPKIIINSYMLILKPG